MSASDHAVVAVLRIHLHFPDAGSLKAKRSELNAVKAGLHQRFGAAVAEVDHQDPWQRSTLLAVCVGQAMILLDVTIVNVALPSIQRELGVTPGNLEWVVNAYALALASLLLVGGALGDRYGRKRVYIAGLVAFTFCSAACALARDDPELIAFRALQGAGAAMMAPLTLAILVDAFPVERRTTAIGIWAGVSGLGFGLGPVVGGVLIGAFDWSAVFWVNVPLGAVAVVLTVVGVRE